MKKRFLLYFLVVLLFSYCKKKDFPENISEDPVFEISATIDGTPISIKAGTLGYYMYSDYKQDTSNMYTFIAEVKPNGCNSTCPNSLKIELNDNQFSTAGGSSNIANSVKSGTYQFVNSAPVTPSLVGYAVQYKSWFNKTATYYNWSFGDGGTSTDANPTHTFSAAGIYNTSLEISDGTIPTTISNPIKVTISSLACKTKISSAPSFSGAISFTNHTTGTAPYTYLWNFGDTTYSTTANPTHYYSYPNRYLVSLKVKDATGDSTQYNYYVNTDLSSKAAPNFSVSSVNAIYTTNVNNQLSKVKISYTDQNGVVYTSNLQSQLPSGSSFEIISVENYKNNERNQATKKIKIAFNCKLYNGTKVVDLKNGSATLAISYK